MATIGTTSDDAWMTAWAPMIALVGTDLSDGQITYAADRVEKGAIRRYLEPLEFDCALHTGHEAARAHGFADVTMPYTAISTFALPPVRDTGEVQFTDASRDAQPRRGATKPPIPPSAPPVSGYFATDTEMEYLRPVIAGERLGKRGNRLLTCVPKQTKVGRGAFVTFESDTVDEAGDAVARTRVTLFLYNPFP